MIARSRSVARAVVAAVVGGGAGCLTVAGAVRVATAVHQAASDPGQGQVADRTVKRRVPRRRQKRNVPHAGAADPAHR